MVAKTSRKGKKAWRRNISAKEAEAAVEKGNFETVQGLSRIPDADLFVFDKVCDPLHFSAAPAARFAP